MAVFSNQTAGLESIKYYIDSKEHSNDFDTFFTINKYSSTSPRRQRDVALACVTHPPYDSWCVQFSKDTLTSLSLGSWARVATKHCHTHAHTHFLGKQEPNAWKEISRGKICDCQLVVIKPPDGFTPRQCELHMIVKCRYKLNSLSPCLFLRNKHLWHQFSALWEIAAAI